MGGGAFAFRWAATRDTPSFPWRCPVHARVVTPGRRTLPRVRLQQVEPERCPCIRCIADARWVRDETGRDLEVDREPTAHRVGRPSLSGVHPQRVSRRWRAADASIRRITRIVRLEDLLGARRGRSVVTTRVLARNTTPVDSRGVSQRIVGIVVVARLKQAECRYPDHVPDDIAPSAARCVPIALAQRCHPPTMHLSTIPPCVGVVHDTK